jgi:uncharacterized protein (DUF305 family)
VPTGVEPPEGGTEVVRLLIGAKVTKPSSVSAGAPLPVHAPSMATPMATAAPRRTVFTSRMLPGRELNAPITCQAVSMTQVEDLAAAPEEEVRLPWWQSKLNLAVVFLAIAILCGGLGWMIGNNRAIPDPNKTDVGFLQDMRTHHEQAVYLGLYYLADTGTSPAIRDIAREIVFGQGIEIGRMIQLLRQFGKPEANPSDTAMVWMNEPTPSDRMPGLASDSDIDKLLAASGRDADTLFVDLMVAHHEGGIHMASYAADHANVSEVRAMAASMVTGQQEEINELRGLVGG